MFTCSALDPGTTCPNIAAERTLRAMPYSGTMRGCTQRLSRVASRHTDAGSASGPSSNTWLGERWGVG